MYADDAKDQAGNAAHTVVAEATPVPRESFMLALTAMVEATSPAPSAAERESMNTLAGSIAGENLIQAAREYTQASKARWESMMLIPDRNEKARQAHIVLCKLDTAAWERCVALLREEGFYRLLPDLRGFLHYLAR